MLGTYHGYNAGRASAEQALLEAGVAAPVGTVDKIGVSGAQVDGGVRAGSDLQVQVGEELRSVAGSLKQLLPFGLSGGAIQCEPEQPSNAPKQRCRLAELTQYHCDLHADRVVCQPIDGIFRV